MSEDDLLLCPRCHAGAAFGDTCPRCDLPHVPRCELPPWGLRGSLETCPIVTPRGALSFGITLAFLLAIPLAFTFGGWRGGLEFDHPVLVDFGAAWLADPTSGEALTLRRELIGTPRYMSPEQGAGVALDAREARTRGGHRTPRTPNARTRRGPHGAGGARRVGQRVAPDRHGASTRGAAETGRATGHSVVAATARVVRRHNARRRHPGAGRRRLRRADTRARPGRSGSVDPRALQ